MATRDAAPLGAPCWIDLWTSEVDGAREFYTELLGWEAGEPDPTFGGYWMFHRDGAPVAGGMGPMGDMTPNNAWKFYFATDDIERTARSAADLGATLFADPSPVGDLGIQVVLADPAGAEFGAWQPGTFQGFSVIGEPGSPSWFELTTTDYERSLEFYRSVFGWRTETLSDTEEFRYTVVSDDEGNQFAGVMDGAKMLPDGGSSWLVYWGVADIGEGMTAVIDLGGTVQEGPIETAYGRMAWATDPFGAKFNLHSAL